MKLKFLAISFSIFVFALPFFAQANEAKQIDEFEYLLCGDLTSRCEWAFQEQKKISDSKIYVIYYEGMHLLSSVWNKKMQVYDEKYINPRRGDAFSRASEIKIYLNTFSEFSSDTIVISDGGYREKFALEIWIVPKGAKSPMSTPTLEEKDVTFRKGKPVKSRDISKCYGGL